MMRAVQARGLPWQLIYCARSRDRFAFVEELHALDMARVQLLPEDEMGRADFAAIVQDNQDAAVYTCGPSGLMGALADAMDQAGRIDALHLERFAPAAIVADNDPAGGFEVELKRQGAVIHVGPDESILDAIRAAGLEHPSSCEMGFCGTCEARVLEGSPDHQDDLLTDAEHVAGDTMMLCVSRASSQRLVLDL